MKPRQIAWKWLLFGLAAAAIAILALLPRQFSESSRLASSVTDMLAAWTGGEVKLTGPVQVSFFPDVAIQSGFELNNATRLPAVKSITADQAKISLDLPALLLGRVRIDAMRLLRPKIALSEVPSLVMGPDQTLRARVANLFGGVPVSVIRLRDGTLYVPTASGKESINKIDLRLDASSGDGAISSFGSFVFRNETVRFALDCDPTSEAGERPQSPIRLTLTSAPLRANVTGTVSLENELQIDGSMTVDAPSLRRLLVWTGVPLPEGQSLQELSASGSARWNGTTLTFDNGTFALGGDRAVGALAITPGARPRIDGTLDFDRLVLDLYIEDLPPDSPGARLALSDQAILKYLDADLRISATEVVANPLRLGRGGFTISAKGGLLASEVGELELCGGQASGRIGLDVTEGDAKLALSANLSGVPVDRCLEPLALDVPLSGIGSLRVEATAEGRTYEEMVQKLGGLVKAGAQNGVVPLDFARLFYSSAPEGDGWSRTAGTMFDQLNADCRLTAGQVRCDTFNMQTRRGLLSGSGSVNLAQKTLDWSLFLANDDQPLKASQLATEHPPRISISGSLAEPTIRRTDRPTLGDGSHPAVNQVSPR
jgi:AsmA protein